MEALLGIISTGMMGLFVYWVGRKAYINRKSFTTDNLMAKSDDALDELFTQTIPKAVTQGLPKASRESAKVAKKVYGVSKPYAAKGLKGIYATIFFSLKVIASPIWVPLAILNYSKNFLIAFLLGQVTDDRKTHIARNQPIVREKANLRLNFSFRGAIPSLFRLTGFALSNLGDLALLPFKLAFRFVRFFALRLYYAKERVDADREDKNIAKAMTSDEKRESAVRVQAEMDELAFQREQQLGKDAQFGQMMSALKEF